MTGNDFQFSVFGDENAQPIATGSLSETDSAVMNASENIITDDVIAVVAYQAATSTDSVAGMSSNMAGDIAESLGVRNQSKGVLVRMDEGRVILDLYVIVKYGKKISDIAWDIQENVKKTVENMTGAIVEAVNVHVSGVDFTQKARKTEE